MAILHPFRAVRPDPSVVADVACVPYDVINAAEARTMAQGKPLSFLHVIRPEIDLPEGTDEHEDAVYETGGNNLRAFVDATYTMREPDPSVYMYRLVMDGRAQTGIFGCVSVDDYDSDVILKHEKTRPSKEDDRTRHILAQGAHAEPIMLTFRDSDAVTGLMETCEQDAPLYDLTTDDGVRHTLWRFAAAQPVVEAFAGIDRLYVADGHHRCKAASRAAAEMNGEEVRYFPAVLFPMGMMQIMPYNRIVRRVPGGVGAFMRTLEERFGLTRDPAPSPRNPGNVSVYAAGRWSSLRLPESGRTGATDKLDVGRLTEFVLEPLLGITDPRTDANIDFVGGIRGTDELERLVDSGAAEIAFSMYPTSIEQLVEVSDAGLLMPPKSTWFEPKLRSGFLVHTF